MRALSSGFSSRSFSSGFSSRSFSSGFSSRSFSSGFSSRSSLVPRLSFTLSSLSIGFSLSSSGSSLLPNLVISLNVSYNVRLSSSGFTSGFSLSLTSGFSLSPSGSSLSSFLVTRWSPSLLCVSDSSSTRLTRRSLSLRMPRLLIFSIVASLSFFSTIASNISRPFRKSFSQVIYKFIIIFLDSSTTLCNLTSVRPGFIIISLLSVLDSSDMFTNTNNLSITESSWS